MFPVKHFCYDSAIVGNFLVAQTDSKSQFRSAISKQGRATMNFRFDCSKKGTSAEVPFIQIYSFCFTNPYFTFTRSNFSSIGSAATHRKKAVAAPCTTSIGKPDI